MAKISSIERLKSEILESTYVNLAQQNRFAVIVEDIEPGLQGGGVTGSTIQFLVRNVSMPGQILAVSEFGRIYGPQVKRAYSPIYNEVTMTIMQGEDGGPQKFFTDWQSSIVATNGKIDQQNQNNTSYDVTYFDEYTRGVQIYQIGKSGEYTYGINLEHVFPNNVSEISYDYGSDNTIVTFNVSLTYYRWNEIKPNDLPD